MPARDRTYLARSGPRRREYQRALYLTQQLAVAPLPPPPEPTVHLDVDVETAWRQHRHSPDAATASSYLTALCEVGTRLAHEADLQAAEQIEAAGCARPDTDLPTITTARTSLLEHQGRWLHIEQQIRRQHRVPSDTKLSTDQLFGDDLTGAQRRWRRQAWRDYQWARDAFLNLTAPDAGRSGRARIRANCYRSLLPPTSVIAEQIPVPARWTVRPGSDLEAAFAAARQRPTIAAAVRLLVDQRARTPAAGPLPITDRTVLAAGARAVFGGQCGGLVGDGYRTSDPQLRAFILGLWSAG